MPPVLPKSGERRQNPGEGRQNPGVHRNHLGWGRSTRVKTGDSVSPLDRYRNDYHVSYHLDLNLVSLLLGQMLHKQMLYKIFKGLSVQIKMCNSLS